MRKLSGIALCVVFLLLAACGSDKVALTRAERRLSAQAHVAPAVVAQLKDLGTSLERLRGTTADYDEYPAAGIVLNTKPNDGREVLRKVKRRLSGTDYAAYLLDETYGYGPDKIAVLKGDDHEFLALVRTDAANYDIEHEVVMKRYLEWEKKYDLKLTGAGQDWMEARIGNPPLDWLAFAKEVYEFCPDVVDQGVGDIPALAKEMERTNDLYLWWD